MMDSLRAHIARDGHIVRQDIATPATIERSLAQWSDLDHYTVEFIPIDGPRCLRRKEAAALAGEPCTGLPSCLPAFLALTRVTVDALPRLVLSLEAALPAPGRAATPAIMS